MPLKKFLLLIFLLPAFARGQELVTDTHPKTITRFPFHQYSGGVMVIRAAFENIKDSFNFILDTGSGGISLDSTTCADYAIESRETDTTTTGIGGKRKVHFVFDKTLHFPGLDLKKLNFHINDYDVLTSVYGEKRDGIIGYIDFINHLSQNVYGYQFKTTLYQAALQGQNTEREVCQALDDINERNKEYDCILIIRGGGSKLDLAWFDNFNIGARIAKSPLPVITGIGHDIDSTVADTVAHLSIKTPTAVADHIIHHNMEFETSIAEATHWISQMARRNIRQHELMLQQTTQMLSILPQEILKKQHFNIDITYKSV